MALVDKKESYKSYPQFYSRYGTKIFSPGQAPYYKVVEIEYEDSTLIILLVNLRRTELIQIIVENVSPEDYEDFYDEVYRIWWRYHLMKYKLGRNE